VYVVSTRNYDEAAKILGTYTDPIPDGLIKAFKDGKCVLFAGSGVSQRCLARNRRPLPTWQELMYLLTSEADKKGLISSKAIQELNNLLAKNEYLMVAQELLETLGEKNVQSVINEALDPDGIIPSRLHELLAITPFRFRITTNYDNLLERAFITTWHRHIERVCIDELQRLRSLLNLQSEFVLKLHGDLDRPETIILGQKQYQYLLQSTEYTEVLDDIFKNNSVLMLGYGLGDIDIQLALDRLAKSDISQQPHFLLCARDTKTHTEKKRLAADRNVHTIEYVDYFGFHNHIDTFLIGVNVALGKLKYLERMRLPVNARIAIHYPTNLTEDGLFVWNLLFREGAIICSYEQQRNQLQYLEKRIADDFQAVDYLLFVVDDKALNETSDFLPILERAFNSACSRGAQTIFLIVGAKSRPAFLEKNINAPTFYVNDDFSEMDLTLLRSYIAQDIRMGYRQE